MHMGLFRLREAGVAGSNPVSPTNYSLIISMLVEIGRQVFGLYGNRTEVGSLLPPKS